MEPFKITNKNKNICTFDDIVFYLILLFYNSNGNNNVIRTTTITNKYDRVKNNYEVNCNKCPLIFVAVMEEQFVLITSVFGYSRG